MGLVVSFGTSSRSCLGTSLDLPSSGCRDRCAPASSRNGATVYPHARVGDLIPSGDTFRSFHNLFIRRAKVRVPDVIPPERRRARRLVARETGRPHPCGPIARNTIERFNTPMKKGLLVLGMLAAVLSAAVASFDETLERALALAAQGRHAQAREVLGPLLEDDSDHPRARLLDGILRAHEGRASEAIEVFERLRREHPEMSEPWNNLAVLYAAEGRFDEARESLLAALERFPSARGHVDLGGLYAELARLAYRRARGLAADRSADPRTEASGGTSSALPGGSGESPAPERPDRAPAAASPPGTRAVCLRSGGIEDRTVLAGVEEWLESSGAEVFEVRRERGRKVGSHQVYLPPLEDREAAAARVREFRARGVRDVEVIESGPLANGISFGVYEVAENMSRRVASLRELGYGVRTRDNWRFVYRHYVEARAKSDPDGIRAAWQERYPDWTLEIVDCP